MTESGLLYRVDYWANINIIDDVGNYKLKFVNEIFYVGGGYYLISVKGSTLLVDLDEDSCDGKYEYGRYVDVNYKIKNVFYDEYHIIEDNYGTFRLYDKRFNIDKRFMIINKPIIFMFD